MLMQALAQAEPNDPKRPQQADCVMVIRDEVTGNSLPLQSGAAVQVGRRSQTNAPAPSTRMGDGVGSEQGGTIHN